MTVAAASITPEATVKKEEIVTLVIDARKGDQQAWKALFERHSPLVWSICRRYQLSRADAEDVCQTVWMRLVDHLDGLCDPAALAGWLSTTTRRECFRVWRAHGLHSADEQANDFESIPDQLTESADHRLLVAERTATLRAAYTRLPPGYQRLIVLLTADPPVPYAEIGSRLGISVGSIGPSRRRCIDKLRRDPAVAALLDPA